MHLRRSTPSPFFLKSPFLPFPFLILLLPLPLSPSLSCFLAFLLSFVSPLLVEPSSFMKITVLSRSGRKIIPGLELHDDATLEDLKKVLYKQNKKWHPNRQRFTLPVPAPGSKPVVLESGKKLKDYFASNSAIGEVVFKDLGPQVSFKAVFFWEYFGPLVLYPLFYLFPDYLYPVKYNGRKHTHLAQHLALGYWSFHYTKRILETFFVHRFSHGTMPLFNLFRNCSYYWGFALFISYFLNHPLYTPASNVQLFIGLAFSLFCQMENLYCHIILRNLRSNSSSKGYEIPKGFLFNQITCANYTTEIGGWFGFNIATQTLYGVLFLLAGTYQMSLWAIAKHKRLKKIFDGRDGREKYPRRWIILPPFL